MISEEESDWRVVVFGSIISQQISIPTLLLEFLSVFAYLHKNVNLLMVRPKCKMSESSIAGSLEPWKQTFLG